MPFVSSALSRSLPSDDATPGPRSGRHGAAEAGITKLAPHDQRRTCARLCHLACGELGGSSNLSAGRPQAAQFTNLIVKSPSGP